MIEWLLWPILASIILWWLNGPQWLKPPSLCPDCGKPEAKVIYYGLPHRMCLECDPPILNGLWSNLTVYLPFNGWFVVYTGSYWRALWRWLRRSE